MERQAVVAAELEKTLRMQCQQAKLVQHKPAQVWDLLEVHIFFATSLEAAIKQDLEAVEQVRMAVMLTLLMSDV